MSVRPALLADVPAIVDLGAALHVSSDYSRFAFDRAKVEVLMRALIAGAGVIFLAEDKGRPIGGIAGGVAPFWFGSDLHGFDYSFFVLPEFRHGSTALRLLACLEAWCRARGAIEMRIGITTGIEVEGTSRFYEWCGYTRNGALFTKGLDHGNR